MSTLLQKLIAISAPLRSILKIPYYNTTLNRLEYPIGTDISTVGAPTDADYLVGTANAGLSAERVITDSISVVKDVSVAGQISFKRAALTGDVTAVQNGNATTIAANAVTNAKLNNMAANTVKVNNTGASANPSDLALTANTFLVRGSTGDIAAGTFGTGISFSGTVATPSSYWDGTNFRNSAGVIIDGIYTENDIVDLNLVTPTDGLAGVVKNPGDNAAATNTTTYPWGVIGNGTKWDVFGGRSMLARMTVPVKVTRPAVTFAGAYTVSDDGTGKVKIKSAAAGAHGLTGAVAVGASIYVSAGTLAGLHEISSIPVDTTGDEIILTTAFSGTPTVTAIAKDTTDNIIVWSFSVPPLRSTSMLFMPILGYGATDSVNDKKVYVDYGGTNFRELNITNTADLSITAETVVMNIATNSQVARSPRANGSDTGAVGAVITGSVNSSIAQTFQARVTFGVPNEVISVLSHVEVIW